MPLDIEAVEVVVFYESLLRLLVFTFLQTLHDGQLHLHRYVDRQHRLQQVLLCTHTHTSTPHTLAHQTLWSHKRKPSLVINQLSQCPPDLLTGLTRTPIHPAYCYKLHDQWEGTSHMRLRNPSQSAGYQEQKAMMSLGITTQSSLFSPSWRESNEKGVWPSLLTLSSQLFGFCFPGTSAGVI